MEQQQRSIIVTAAVGLIILAIIIGSIYYLVRFIQGRQKTASITNEATSSASIAPSEETGSNEIAQTQPQTNINNTQGNPPANTKIYNGGEFQLIYPNNWGVLDCANSQNIELDPLNGANSNPACDTATKPVTVLVNSGTGCQGETVTLGQIKATKSKKTYEDGYIDYKWCTQTTPALEISHRVSKNNESATSKEDFSK